MKNKTKILVVLCIVAMLALTMCVSTFADEVADGEIVRLTIDSDGASGYADSISIAPSNNIRVIYTHDGNVIYDDFAYKVDIREEATYLVVVIYHSVDDYNDFSPTVNYSSSLSGIAVFDFYGLTSYQIGTEQGVTMEVLGTNDTVNGFFGVITEIMGFITVSMTSVQSVFFVDGNLTMLGALSVLAIGVSLVLLIIAIVRKFLQLRG